MLYNFIMLSRILDCASINEYVLKSMREYLVAFPLIFPSKQQYDSHSIWVLFQVILPIIALYLIFLIWYKCTENPLCKKLKSTKAIFIATMFGATEKYYIVDKEMTAEERITMITFSMIFIFTALYVINTYQLLT